MINLLDSVKDYYFDISYLDKIITYEIYIEVLSKLRASQHNDKAIRLNLVQAKGFLSFLNVYAKIGNYESANAHILSEKIYETVYKKALTINH